MIMPPTSNKLSVRDSFTLFDACHILWTVRDRVLKFHVWIPHGKIADIYSPCPSYLPFWGYAPFEILSLRYPEKYLSKGFEI